MSAHGGTATSSGRCGSESVHRASVSGAHPQATLPPNANVRAVGLPELIEKVPSEQINLRQFTTQVSPLSNRFSSSPLPRILTDSSICSMSMSSYVGRSTHRNTPIGSGNSG